MAEVVEAIYITFLTLVAGPGVAPGLEDYEPSVRCTLPRMFEQSNYITRVIELIDLLSYNTNVSQCSSVVRAEPS